MHFLRPGNTTRKTDLSKRAEPIWSSFKKPTYTEEAIEYELTEKRHYTSTNRWVPTGDIKNGYLVNTRHTSLISDAAALDYLTF